MHNVPVFFHRSTIVCVDNNHLILKAISSLLESSHEIKTFPNPIECFQFLDAYTPPLTQIDFLQGCIEHDHYETADHLPVDFNLPALRQIFHYPKRLEEISLLIVDYHLPHMTGLDLCRKLRNSPFKKILLSGETTQDQALDAFNENIIDRFVRKDSQTLSQVIKQFATELTQEYFQERTQAFVSHLEADHKICLSDPVFSRFFQKWRTENHIKEFTLIDKVGTFILIREDEKAFYFIVHTDHSLNNFYTLYDDTVDRDELLRAVKLRKHIPFFGIGKESWDVAINEWPSHFYTPNLLEGREKYYWAVVEAEY